MTDFSDTPVVIFAGGKGARFDAETQFLPKPLILLDGVPLIEHIIVSFYLQGFREFIIPVGYLGEKFFEWRASLEYSEMLQDTDIIILETGFESHTGARLSQCAELIGDRHFVMTYGDGLSSVKMRDVYNQHMSFGNMRPLVTMTIVNPPGRFGVVETSREGLVHTFGEKPTRDWINGGFMYCEPAFIEDYIGHCGPNELEGSALTMLANDRMLAAHCHVGYWQCIDTRRDLEKVNADIVKNYGAYPWL